MVPAPFDYLAPKSLKEALDLLSSKGEDARLLAGGQSLVPLMKLRLARPRLLIDLRRIPDLDTIRAEGDTIVIGSLTTHAQTADSELLKGRCPLLSQTAATIGDVQVRNLGTIGGSLAHADVAGDLHAAILALGAEMKAIGPKGERWIKAEDFFIGPLTSALKPDEILTEVKVAALQATKTAYVKCAPSASGYAVAGIAVCLRLDHDGICRDIAIGITGVSDKPYRAHGVERLLRGKKIEAGLIEEAAVEVTRDRDVVEDLRGSREYRSHVACVSVTRAIQAALKS